MKISLRRLTTTLTSLLFCAGVALRPSLLSTESFFNHSSDLSHLRSGASIASLSPSSTRSSQATRWSQFKFSEQLKSLETTQVELKKYFSVTFYQIAQPSPLISTSGFNHWQNWGIQHIHADKSWKIESGNPQVLVAVIDTGVDSQHPDLSKNIWKNNETKGFGWDFVSESALPLDDHGHGTHISGIIGAMANEKSGIAGVSPHVSIMSVKYYSDKNSGMTNLQNTIRAIDYAVDHGAKIINYSGGGPEYCEEEFKAIKRAESKGVLVVAAAGNEAQNTDLVQNYYYPAAYALSNIISVAAINTNNQLIRSSNWGKRHVDVAAPGENIYSTLPGKRYGFMTGTSQATAFVTGLAALLLAHDPTLKPAQIKSLITKNVEAIPQLKEKIASGGFINAEKTLIALDQIKKQPLLVQTFALQSQPNSKNRTIAHVPHHNPLAQSFSWSVN